VNLTAIGASGRDVVYAGGDSQAEGTIVNDEASATVAIADVSQNEGNGGTTSFDFVVTLTGDVDTDFTVDYATAVGGANPAAAGTDYTADSGQVTFTTTGPKTQTITVDVAGDTVVELDETFLVNLTAIGASGRDVVYAGGDSQAEGTISNDDSTTLSINGPATMAEGDIQPYTISLSNPIEFDDGINNGDLTVVCLAQDGTASVQYDLSGLLVSPGGSYIVSSTISSGTVNQSFDIEALSDTDVENDENFEISIPDNSPPVIDVGGFTTGNSTIDALISLGAAQVVTTIQDNDQVGVNLTLESPSNPVTEDLDETPTGPMNLTFRVTLDTDDYVLGTAQASVRYDTVSGTAIEGQDFVGSHGILTFDGGNEQQPGGPGSPTFLEFTVQVSNDQLIEADETFIVRITPQTNVDPVPLTPDQHEFTVTIQDNDVLITTTYNNGGTIATPSGVGADHVADIGSEVPINISWAHGLESFTGFTGAAPGVGNTTSISAFGSPGLGANAPGDIVDYMMTVAGVAGATIPLEAEFRHAITFDIGDNGSANIDNPTASDIDNLYSPLIINEGESVLFEFFGDDTGVNLFCVSDVIVDSVSVGAEINHSFNTVTDDHTLAVEFRANRVTVNIIPLAEVGDSGIPVTERGQWKLVNSSGDSIDPQDAVTGWNNSGYSVRTSCLFSYTIVFKTIDGWYTPDSIPLTVDTTTTGEIIEEGEYRRKAYTLTLQQSYPAGMPGQLTLAPVGEAGLAADEYIYMNGTEVELGAVAAAGTTFYQWQGSVTDSSYNITVTMDSDKTITAVFTLPNADNDGDGYSVPDDCNDDDPLIHPGADEICGDGVDQNCDPTDEICPDDETDNDNDGFAAYLDCNDNDASVYPGAEEIPGDGKDNDCVGGDREVQSTETICVDPAEVPLETQVQAAPSLVMFLIDDSGSMDFEFMTPADEGGFDGGGSNVRHYLYPRNLGGSQNDNTYGDADRFLTEAERRLWQSQWAGFNQIYFNPTMAYKPWPRWNTLPGTDGSSGSLDFNADPDNPRMNPIEDSKTLDMSTTYFAVKVLPGAPQNYVAVRKNQYDNNRRVVADAIRLVDASNPSNVFMVDDGTSSGINGYYEDNTVAGDDWSDSNDSDAVGYQCRTNRSSNQWAYWYLRVPPDTYHVEAFIPFKDDLSRHVDYEIGRETYSTFSVNDINQEDYDTDNPGNDDHWYRMRSNVQFAGNLYSIYEIPVAHYFVIEDGEYTVGDRIILVAMSSDYGTGGSFEYYEFTDDGDGRVENGELQLINNIAMVPSWAIPTDNSGAPMSYDEVRQNFANWYSFYRRRELTAKAAIGQVIDEIDDVKIGFAVLNARDSRNHPVQVVKKNHPSDQSEQLLRWLYEIQSSGGTPLRRGLQDVGQYFDQNDGTNDGDMPGTVPSPWSDQDAGGGCQRAFVIAMTDGYWNKPDYWVEGALQTLDADGDGYNRLGEDSEYDQGVFAGPNDGNSPNLGDIAMYYYENDLVNLPDDVPAYRQDNADHQHMVTYGVAFGVVGQNNPLDYPDCLPQCEPGEIGCPEPTCPTWPVPYPDTPTVIDDLYHASVNGRGQFFTADNPQKLIDALVAVMQGIQNTAASGSSVAINAQELQGDTALYQATYVPSNWTGDIKAKPLDPTTGGVVQVQDGTGAWVDQVDWSAADRLDNRTAARKIITFNDTTEGGVIFNYTSISNNQRDLLDPATGFDVTLVTNTIEFLRGDTSNESANGGIFRDRVSLLGDVVHASPVPYRWNLSQPGVVFVGANDGMLHMLDEVTGDEIFSYVPNLAYANLHELTQDPYTHKYFVDQEPYIRKLGAFGSTVLVGGMGRGGRGYYCLDISSISSGTFDAELGASTIVKWEYPVNGDPEDDTVDPDMGYSYSQAYVVNSEAGWVVIFGNGYDSGSGEAVLYVIRLNSDGSMASPVPTKIRTNKGNSTTDCNGLSTPALIDVNVDGLVDFAFAGDLLGNMWKFDLRDSNISNWKVAYNSQADGNGQEQPLFQAKNASGFRQPITTRPDIMRPCLTDREGYMVLFGTGRYIGLDDFADAGAVQTIYGIWDWAEDWENLSPLLHSADKLNPTSKYLGEFDGNRQLSNLIGNSAIPETEQVIYEIDLSGVNVGDTIAIEGTLFTAANLTDEENHRFLGTAGLREAIEDPTYGVSGISVEVTPSKVILRTNPPGDTIFINNVSGGITWQSIDLKVSLLKQHVVYHKNDEIVISDNPIDWFDPSDGTGQHVGWYYDLPENSERLVNDVIIRDGILYTVPTIPTNSPCEAGGRSVIYGLNACNGGRTNAALFDINGDLMVNNADLVNIGTAANPIWVAPTGLRRSGLLYSPAILGVPGTGRDVLHFSTSGGKLETEIAAGEKLGFMYWRTW
jgi:hypothetical protein